MHFGFTLKPDHSIERTLALTRQAEAAGFDYGWLFDSPRPVAGSVPAPDPDGAQTTTRMRLGHVRDQPGHARADR